MFRRWSSIRKGLPLADPLHRAGDESGDPASKTRIPVIDGVPPVRSPLSGALPHRFLPMNSINFNKHVYENQIFHCGHSASGALRGDVRRIPAKATRPAAVRAISTATFGTLRGSAIEGGRRLRRLHLYGHRRRRTLCDAAASERLLRPTIRRRPTARSRSTPRRDCRCSTRRSGNRRRSTISPLPVRAEETKFRMLAIGDPQVTTTAQVYRFETETSPTSTPTWRPRRTDCPPMRSRWADIVGNKWELYPDMVKAMAREQDVGSRLPDDRQPRPRVSAGDRPLGAA